MCQVLSLLAIKTPRATSDELSGVINFEQSQYNIERMKLVLLFITLNINLYLRTCLFFFFFSLKSAEAFCWKGNYLQAR